MRIVEISKKIFTNYLEFIDGSFLDEINEYISILKNKKIAMINTTSFGGGVAEILHTLIPLMNDIGLHATWFTIDANDKFFNFTKKMHNALQGQQAPLSNEEINMYLEVNKLNFDNWVNDYDYVVIHDPQVAPFISFSDRKSVTKWIWRCHIDTSTPNMDYWNLLEKYVVNYDAVIFTLEQYIKDRNKFKKIFIIHPSIDPLSPKNIQIEDIKRRKILKKYSIDPNRRIITQVSRFDPWKDPLGVIDVYKELKKHYPDLQLILAGSMATDDPEGWVFYDKTIRHAGEDFDIHILSNFNGVGNIEINAIQTSSDLVLQKSTREGFGLTVSEALWKSKPVIGGNVGGIPLQIKHGETGFLVNNIEEAIKYSAELLDDPHKSKIMGIKGKRFVKDKFLITRHLKDYLKLFVDLL